jgi:hypothetical protein
VDEETPGRDLGANRDARVRSCCAAVGGSWCVLPDGHAGDEHIGKIGRPLEAKP